jgi:hypothetical protein
MRVMVALAAVTAVCLAQAPAPNPRLSDDEVAIYRAYLETVAKKTKIHLGNRTVAIAPLRNQPCLTSVGITIPESVGSGGFDAAVLNDLKIELVDADAQREKVRSAKDQKAASEAALYTLSSIAFDKDRRHAAMQYSIACGGSCSNSAILIFEKVKDKWRWTGRFCGRLSA